MKKKTLLKLLKRFLALPLHHIDTSIVIEKPTTEEGRACTAYLNIIGYKYRGRFSIYMLGEYFIFVVSMLEYSKRVDLLEILYSLIKNKKIELVSGQDIEETANKIKKLDERIETTDRLILASAIKDNADSFVTLDKDLIHNKAIEKEFDIKIRHPKELI